MNAEQDREVMTPRQVQDVLKQGRTDFSNVAVSDSLHLYDVTVEDHLEFHGAIVQGTLSLDNAVIKGFLDFSNAVITHDLCLRGTTVQEELHLNDIVVEHDFCIHGTRAKGLELHNAEVKGNISCRDDLAMAITCFFHFGKRIQFDLCAAVELLSRLPPPLGA